MNSSTPTFFVDPGFQEEGEETEGEEKVSIGAAQPSVVRALEAARKDEASAEGEALLGKLREIDRQLGHDGDEVGLAATIRRVCRAAYIDLELTTSRCDGKEQEEEEDGYEDDNDRRRRRLVQSRIPPRKAPKREKKIVGATFKRHQFKYDRPTVTGGKEKVTRDYAFDWKVVSPHQPSLRVSAREWFDAHQKAEVRLPPNLREELLEDLGIDELPPNPPGTGPLQERPVGDARSGGSLRVEAANGARRVVFTPPVRPHSSEEGYLHGWEMLPWSA